MTLEDDRRKVIDFALESNPDSIVAYEQLINTHLDPSSSSSSSPEQLLLLLEEATREFVDNPRYKFDYRFLRIWLLYASLVDNNRVIFELLSRKEIGELYAANFL